MKKILLITTLFVNLVFAAFIDESLIKNEIFSEDAKLEVVVSDLGFSEGPLYLENERIWIFSDLINDKIYTLDENNTLGVFLDPSGITNGMAKYENKGILQARHSRNLTLLDENKNEKILATNYKGKKLNSPNDVIISKNGDIYFTDPSFGISQNGLVNEKSELGFNGVYKLSGDKLTLLTAKIKIPNGISLNQDETKLYVADTFSGKIYSINLENLKLKEFIDQNKFIKQKENADGFADGMAVDESGNIFTTTSLGVSVFSKDAKLLGFIHLDETPTNISFGKGEVLITARSRVYKITL